MFAKDPIAVLSDLIAFKSVSRTENSEIVQYLEDLLKPLGFDLIRIKHPTAPERYNLLCTIGPEAPGGLLLSGHLDVVPVVGQEWQSDPFVLTVRDDRLYGRGTADMKGFIAATLCALHRIKLNQLKKPLSLLWTCDEEVGCAGSFHAAPLLKNYFTHLPKAALIGEPTEFGVLRMHAGHVTVRISAKGRGVHSSNPEHGVSAIKGITRALQGIFELETALKSQLSIHREFKRPFVTMNVGQVKGGTAVNIVPDGAHAIIGFRQLPDTPVQEIFERIKKASMQYQENSDVRICCYQEEFSPAMVTPAGSRLETILQPLAQDSDGCAAQYSTDGGNLSANGITCLVFGPGSISVAHQANEYVERSQIVLAEQYVARVIEQWFFSV